MFKLIASTFTGLATAVLAAPALGQTPVKTELVELSGQSVAKMRLNDSAYTAWVVDTQNILYRDDRRDYYLVTLSGACEPLSVRRRTFAFHPTPGWQLRADRSYEVRPYAGKPCDVAKIAQISDDAARPLRDASLWRAW